MKININVVSKIKSYSSKHVLMILFGLSMLTSFQVAAAELTKEDSVKNKSMPAPPTGPYRSTLHSTVVKPPQQKINARQWAPSLPAQWQHDIPQTSASRNSTPLPPQTMPQQNSNMQVVPHYRMPQQPNVANGQWMPPRPPQWNQQSNWSGPNWNGPIWNGRNWSSTAPNQPPVMNNRQWMPPAVPVWQGPRYPYPPRPAQPYNRPMPQRYPSVNNFPQPPYWGNPNVNKMPPQYRPWR